MVGSLTEIHKRYPSIFAVPSEPDERRGDESGNKSENEGNNKTTTRTDDTFYIWTSMIHAVSQLTLEPFSKVYEMNIYEFLNYTVYIRRKNKEMAEEMKRQQAAMRSRR